MAVILCCNIKERDSQFFALDNTCNYRGGPLADGQVSGHEVTCPWHGATFDVQTGEVVGPAGLAGLSCDTAFA